MKHLLLLVCLSLSHTFLSAQSPNWAWAQNIKSSNAKGFTIKEGPAGSVYVGGQFNDTLLVGSQSYYSHGNADGFLTKYDSTGNALWTVTAGGANYDYFLYIVTDNAGNCYVTGSFFSPQAFFGGTTLSSPIIGAKGFIAKYDTNGNLVFAKHYGDDTFTMAGIDADGFGNIYACANFNVDTINIGNFHLANSSADYEIILFKTDTAGNVTWAQSKGGNGEDRCSGIHVSRDTTVLLTGSFKNSTINFNSASITASTNGDIYVMRLDSAGNEGWILGSAGGTTLFPSSKSIIIDKSGFIYITGNFNNTLNFNGISLVGGANQNGFLFKINQAGIVQSGNMYGNLAQVNAIQIASDQENNIYASGYYSQSDFVFAGDTLLHSGTAFSTDVFVVKFDSLSNEQWAKKVGSAVDEFAQGIAVNSNNEIFITGYFNSATLLFDNHILILNNSAVYNGFIAKLGSVTTGFAEIQKDNLFIYPNPASQYFNVKFNGASCYLQLFSMEGKLVKQCKLSHASEKVEINNLNPGMYFVKLKDSDGIKSGKIIVN